MARPKKTTANIVDNNDMLSEKDLYEVLKFAMQIYRTDPLGYFTPDINHQNIVDLNNNPKVPTKENVMSALTDYKNNSSVLKSYSEFMESFDMLYKRIIEYYSNMLAFDLDIECTNAYAPQNDYKSDEYAEDKRRVYKFLDSFDYKSEFRKVVKQLLRSQTFYTWFRDSQGTFDNGYLNLNDETKHKTSRYCLQTMPQNFCKITGRWEYGYLYDFDMTYFTHAGTTLNSYDPVFKKYFKNVFGDNIQQYTPTTPLNNRYGDFANWTQTSPDDNAWVFVMDESNIASPPFLIPNLMNFLTNKEVEDLQRDKDLLSARGILAGEIQLLDKQKSGQSTDAMAYNMKTLMKMLALVKKGLTNNINAVAMPAGSPKFYQFTDSNTTMSEDQITNTVAQSASANRIIYSSDRMSETEAKNAVVTDYLMIAKLYPQFEHFLNFFVNKKTRKYKFKFTFSGSTYPFMKENLINKYTALMDKGVVLSTSAYAKVLDMTPMTFDRLLEEGKYSEWTDKLTSVIQSVYTQSGNDKDSGRPKVDSENISDSGATSREYGGG